MNSHSKLILIFFSVLLVGASAFSNELANPNCGPVQPKTLFDVCNRYTTSEGKVMCFQAGKNAKFDECALGFCDTYHTENGCTQCIRAVRNKKYTVDALNQCNQFSEESVATSCMDASGSPIVNLI